MRKVADHLPSVVAKGTMDGSDKTPKTETMLAKCPFTWPHILGYLFASHLCAASPSWYPLLCDCTLMP